MGYQIKGGRSCSQCAKKAIGRGLCHYHYYKAKRQGTLLQHSVVSPDSSFDSRVQKGSGCWIWIGTRNSYGYGIFLLAGECPVRAHRYAYEREKGPIPDGLVVRHSCDNPPCVNPAHLSLGTKADNAADARDRGRMPSGKDHWNAKIRPEEVEKIKNDPRTHAEIGREYGISQGTVSRIKSGLRRANG